MQVAFNSDLDDAEDMLDRSVEINGSLDDYTLRLSYHLIRERWTREDRLMAVSATALE
jgi:hypothetical protein